MEGVVKRLYKVYENKSEASHFQAMTRALNYALDLPSSA